MAVVTNRKPCVSTARVVSRGDVAWHIRLVDPHESLAGLRLVEYTHADTHYQRWVPPELWEAYTTWVAAHLPHWARVGGSRWRWQW